MRNLAVISAAGSVVGSVVFCAVEVGRLHRLHIRMFGEVNRMANGVDELKRDLPAVVAAYVDGFRGGQYAAEVELRVEQRRREDQRGGGDRRSARGRAEHRWDLPNGGNGA